MAKSIKAPVGNNCGPGGNRPDDTRTIQELLNKVPTSSGGPNPLLIVDGICGQKTKAAIGKFQVQQFGWSVADCTVEPGRQTLSRLNSYDAPPAPGPVKPKPSAPTPPPAPIEPVSNYFMIRGLRNNVFGGPNSTSSESADYFEIHNVLHKRKAVFRYDRPNNAYRGAFHRKPLVQLFKPSYFKTAKAYSLNEFQVAVSWFTNYDDAFKPTRSVLEFKIRGENISLEIDYHQPGRYPFKTLGACVDLLLVEPPSAG